LRLPKHQKDDSLNDDLDEPDIIAERIRNDLQMALSRFELILNDMKSV